MKIKRSIEIPDRDVIQWVVIKPEEFWVDDAERLVTFKNVDDNEGRIFKIKVIRDSYHEVFIEYAPQSFFNKTRFYDEILYNKVKNVYCLAVKYNLGVFLYLSKIKPVGKL